MRMERTSGLRGDGTATGGDDRQAPDRQRSPDRRDSAGRRDYDRRFAGLSMVMAAFWAIVGAIVVLFLFFVALDAVNPRETRTVSLIVLVLAVLWLAHSWRRLFLGGSGSRSDRERRGF